MCGATPKLRTLLAELTPNVLHPTIDQKKTFCNAFMDAKCNKNGRHIFNVFAWCRLLPKTANPLRPSRKMQNLWHANRVTKLKRDKAVIPHIRSDPCASLSLPSGIETRVRGLYAHGGEGECLWKLGPPVHKL